MKGLKHLIECRCILPTLKNRKDAPLHKFIVFSVVDENDEVMPKIVNCNNCGVSHNVIGICKSQILNNKEMSRSAMTIDDIALMIPEGVSSILKSHEKTLPDYEHVKFMIDNNIQGDFITLTSEVIDDKKVGKVLHYRGEGKFTIEPYQIDEMLK